MDRKTRKRIEVLRERLHKRQLQLTGARQQRDEERVISDLQDEIAKIQAELKTLRGVAAHTTH